MATLTNMDNKLFVVTGATSGIGKQITSSLCECGGRVIAIGRNENELVKLENRYPSRLFSLKSDVRDSERIIEKLSTFIKLYGKIDGVVHAAGVTYDTPLRVFNKQKANEIMDVSFWSAVDLIQYINKKNNHNKCCSYVLLSSVAAYSGGKALFAYAAAKSAVQSLARSLCKEIASDGSRINSVSPGVVRTKMTEEVEDNYGLNDKIKNAHLLGLGEVNDVSNMVIFLLSDSARWITGRDFVVDGGYLFGGFE